MSLNLTRLIYAVSQATNISLDYQHELDELLELQRLMEKDDPEKDWQEQIEIVSTSAMCELMNMTTYDDYGKLARQQDGIVSQAEYAAEVRRWHPTLTDSHIDCGYSIINDLWHDNEAEGNNDKDGSYDRRSGRCD